MPKTFARRLSNGKRLLRLVLFECLALIIGFTVLIVAAEIILKFLPVNEGMLSKSVNASSPIFQFEPNRTTQWSQFWNFSMVNEVKINNYGFVNNIDYDPKDQRPLVAIIGDSFIEAVHVPWLQTGTGRLYQEYGDTVRFYTFAAAGAPMSQYLAYAEYAREQFQPNRLVILIVGNDFDDSLLKYNVYPGFFHFEEQQDQTLALQLVDRPTTLLKKMLRMSDLGMYLGTNVKLQQHLKEVFTQLKNGPEVYVGNTIADANIVRIIDSKKVVDTFLAMLPQKSGLEPRQVLFLLDGIRPELYDQEELRETEGSFVDVMRNYFLQAATDINYEVIDLQPLFIEHYQQYQQPFEFPKDNHWNAVANSVFADAIAQSQTIGLLKDQPQ